MTNESVNSTARGHASGDRAVPAMPGDESSQNIPVLLAELYREAPEKLRPTLLEFLLRPVGPLAVVTIASGAFAHLLYRLRLDAVPISLEDAARISSDHVLQLARFVEQCSPTALLRIGSLISGSPVFLASMSGSALLVALGAWRRRRRVGPGT